MDEKTNREFNQAMLDIYNKARSEANYTPSVFFRMISEHGGYETARRLIHSPNVSEGYVKLFELGRLDLTVEAVIIEDEQWLGLFTERELEICRKRLHAYGYKNLEA